MHEDKFYNFIQTDFICGHFSGQVIGEEYRSGTLTIKLKRYVMTGTLNNSYTLWVSKTKPHRPIRYETEGFDLLLVGYYDHYYLDYISFHAWEFDFQVMQIPQGWYAVLMSEFCLHLLQLIQKDPTIK